MWSWSSLHVPRWILGLIFSTCFVGMFVFLLFLVLWTEINGATVRWSPARVWLQYCLFVSPASEETGVGLLVQQQRASWSMVSFVDVNCRMSGWPVFCFVRKELCIKKGIVFHLSYVINLRAFFVILEAYLGWSKQQLSGIWTMLKVLLCVRKWELTIYRVFNDIIDVFSELLIRSGI